MVSAASIDTWVKGERSKLPAWALMVLELKRRGIYNHT